MMAHWKPTRRAALTALFSAVIHLGSAVAFGFGFGVARPSRALAAEVLQPEPVNEESYTESFVAFIDATDGTYFKVQLGISNVGPGDRKGACRVLMAKVGATPWSHEAVVDGDWDYARGVLRIGKCRATVEGARAGAEEGATTTAASANPVATPKTLAAAANMPAEANMPAKAKMPAEGKGGLTIEGDLDGRTFVLKLAAMPRRERVMRVSAGTRFYESDVMIPWAPADLVVKRTSDGQVLAKTRGTGYADHSRSTTYPTDTAQRWIRFRALTDAAQRQLILVREPTTGDVEGWTWTAAGRKPISRMRVAVRGSKHAPQVRALIDGEGGPWRVTSKALLFRHAPLENRGVLGALVGAAVGNPVTYTYRAVLETKGGKAINGLLEMAISDE